MVRSEMIEGVPLANGPPGSAASVDNISAASLSAKTPKQRCWSNHGVLASAPTRLRRSCHLIVEEAFQMAIYAEVLGGAKPIPPEMLKATVGRRDEFARAGTQRA